MWEEQEKVAHTDDIIYLRLGGWLGDVPDSRWKTDLNDR